MLAAEAHAAGLAERLEDVLGTYDRRMRLHLAAGGKQDVGRSEKTPTGNGPVEPAVPYGRAGEDELRGALDVPGTLAREPPHDE